MSLYVVVRVATFAPLIGGVAARAGLLGMSAIDTGTEQLLAEVDDGVAVVTMNRPERRNALTVEMLDALGRVLADVERDDAVGAVVLTGAGGAFCAGGDVKAFAADVGRPAAADREQRQLASQRATSGRLWSM